MNLPTDQEWSAEMAADQLSGESLWRGYLPGLGKPTRPRPTKDEISSLERRVKEAMLLDHIKFRIKHRTGNDGRPLEVHVMRPIDVIEWALEQGIQIPDEYCEWYNQVTDPDQAETEEPYMRESHHARAGREGGLAKGKTNATRDELIFKWYQELAGNASWASTIQTRLELRGIEIGADRIRQIVKEKKQKESEG